jgi:1-acyl-sn-glycerol-3-phosphate acyltransferase
MKIILKPFLFIYNIYAILVFIVIMLLVFPFAIIASFFGKIRGGNMIMGLCRIWADTWLALIGIWLKRIYESPHDKRKPYIFLTNHSSYLDAALIPKVYRQAIRPLGKAEMSRVPVFGFIYKNAIVTVDRESPGNRAASIRILKSIVGKMISVVVFPEGTFNMGDTPLKEFFDGAFRIAIETGTAVKPVLFIDAYKRMHHESLFSINPGPCRIVYCDEIPVDSYTLKDIRKLKEDVYAIMTKKLLEYHYQWKHNPAGPAQ